MNYFSLSPGIALWHSGFCEWLLGVSCKILRRIIMIIMMMMTITII